jgi:hypothetical protein
MDKATLLTRRIPEGDVEIDGLGTVKVRGMSRYELIHASRIREEKGDLAAERFILAACMVVPALGEDDVAEWQKASLGPEINIVAMKVNELSGTAQGADKSNVPSDGNDGSSV